MNKTKDIIKEIKSNDIAQCAVLLACLGNNDDITSVEEVSKICQVARSSFPELDHKIAVPLWTSDKPIIFVLDVWHFLDDENINMGFDLFRDMFMTEKFLVKNDDL